LQDDYRSRHRTRADADPVGATAADPRRRLPLLVQLRHAPAHPALLRLDALQRLRAGGGGLWPLAVVGLGLASRRSLRLSLPAQPAHPQVVHRLLPTLDPPDRRTALGPELPHRLPSARRHLHLRLQLHEQRHRAHGPLPQHLLPSLHAGGPVLHAAAPGVVPHARHHQLLQGIHQVRDRWRAQGPGGGAGGRRRRGGPGRPSRQARAHAQQAKGLHQTGAPKRRTPRALLRLRRERPLPTGRQRAGLARAQDPDVGEEDVGRVAGDVPRPRRLQLQPRPPALQEGAEHRTRRAHPRPEDGGPQPGADRRPPRALHPEAHAAVRRAQDQVRRARGPGAGDPLSYRTLYNTPSYRNPTVSHSYSILTGHTKYC
ncbi:hypothetical protein PENTCL1PPCAC_3820, partial [Pristionchus entomophagus]